MREKYREYYIIKNIKIYFDKYVIPDILRYMHSIQSFFVKINPKYISWDRVGQSDISEVSVRERGEMLEDRLKRDFPIDRFLSLYREWESATESGEKTRLFALLRDLHQSAGINKKSIAIWADREMELFGQYVSDIRDLRQRSKVRLRDRSIQPIELDRWELEKGISGIEIGPIVVDISLNIEPEKQRIPTPDRIIPKVTQPQRKAPKEVREKILDFSGAQKRVTEIQKSILDPGDITNIFKRLNAELNKWYTADTPRFNSYLGKSLNDIEMAIIWQGKDGEYYVFDRVENNARQVYRLDKNGIVIGSITVKPDGSLSESRWAKMEWVPFTIPSPKLVSK